MNLRAEPCSVSVVIPTRNGGNTFQLTLEALQRQEGEFVLDLVVIDSSSDDGTAELAEAAGAAVTIIPAETFTYGAVRDQLCALSTGQVIVTLSQDATPADNLWLSNLVGPILRDEADIVQGVERCGDRPGFFWQQAGCFYFTGEWERFIAANGGIGLSAVCLALSRRAWQTTGFGPMPVCEDKLLLQRAFNEGLRIQLETNAVVLHSHSYTVRTLIKRCANEGLGLRCVGLRFGPVDALRGITRGWIYKTLLKGLVTRAVTTPAELLFPVIRPLSLWFGNRFLRELWR